MVAPPSFQHHHSMEDLQCGARVASHHSDSEELPQGFWPQFGRPQNGTSSSEAAATTWLCNGWLHLKPVNKNRCMVNVCCLESL